MNIAKRIATFTDLDSWKVGHQLVLEVYKETGSFPSNENFGLVSQMRRSAVSITSNIAEGFSRFSFKEKNQFYFVALSSATELQNQIMISRDIGYLAAQKADRILEQVVRVQMILRKFTQKTRQLAVTS